MWKKLLILAISALIYPVVESQKRTRASCPDPGVPYQGNRTGQDFRHGHTVTFTCPKDYVMNGESTIKCLDGKWSNNTPSCHGFPFFWINGYHDDVLLSLHGAAKKFPQYGRTVLYLDGSRGTFAETPAIPIHSRNLTIAVWIKLMRYSGTQTIYGDWSFPHSFRFFIERDGRLCGQFRDDFRKDIIADCTARRFVVPINRWIQVAMTWSRAGRVVFMKLFINGEMKLNRTAAHNLNINFKNSGHAVYDIGLKRDSGTTTHAYLRELMVFGRELQINKIKHLWFGRQFMPLSN